MASPVGVASRLLSNGARLLRQAAGLAALPRGAGFWLRVRLAPPLHELRPPLFFSGHGSSLALIDVLTSLEAAAFDPQVDGVFLELGGAPQGLAGALAVRRAVEGVLAQGKPVVAFGEVLGTEDVLVGSAATRLWIPETGSVFLVGLRTEGIYLGELLESIGVRPDVVRIGEYKTAAEALLRRGMSPEQREQLEALMDDRFGELVNAIARGRNLEPDAVSDRIDAGPYSAPAALDAGLIDGCLYPDEFEEQLELLTPVPPPERPGPRRVRFIDAALYHALRASDPGWRPLLADLPHMAYVVASGVIRRGASLQGVSSVPFQTLFQRLRADARVRGVVVRVDSPGGDALASDSLHRALHQLRQEKPVVVSMGEVAASGGYYLAAAADVVLAEGASVTGSIGVVGGKVSLAGLYERLGIARDAVERGARAGLLTEARSFNAGERAVVRRQMEALYDTFLTRVSEGRSLEREAVERAAGGRVFSGARAERLGLVDRLGGPLEALAEARRQAGLGPGERVLLELHPRIPSFGGLRSLIGLMGHGRT